MWIQLAVSFLLGLIKVQNMLTGWNSPNFIVMINNRFLFYILIAFITSCNPKPDIKSSIYRLVGEKSYLSGDEAINIDSTINVVVEIPAGTTQKWEVEKSTGELIWTLEGNKERVVNYLGYPGNYGMIPKTLLPKELGGDGDPLDVLILGASIKRGSVVKAKIIGVLKLLDRGEQDDKLIAVSSSSTFANIDTIEELQQEFDGIAEIIELWFTNYKGVGMMKSQGFASKQEAYRIFYQSINAYKNKKRVIEPEI
jgi:inorganic pyrophosphatase